MRVPLRLLDYYYDASIESFIIIIFIDSNSNIYVDVMC